MKIDYGFLIIYLFSFYYPFSLEPFFFPLSFSSLDTSLQCTWPQGQSQFAAMSHLLQVKHHPNTCDSSSATFFFLSSFSSPSLLLYTLDHRCFCRFQSNALTCSLLWSLSKPNPEASFHHTTMKENQSHEISASFHGFPNNCHHRSELNNIDSKYCFLGPRASKLDHSPLPSHRRLAPVDNKQCSNHINQWGPKNYLKIWPLYRRMKVAKRLMRSKRLKIS